MKTINVKGAIVSNDDAWIYELFEIEHTSPKQIDESISEINGDKVIVEINSGGGSVFAGSEIYTKLKKLKPNVEIIGLAGSAASVIAMAGEKVSISPTAQIMVHNASTIAWGDKQEMDDTSLFLDSIDSSIAYAYNLKTGLEMSELAEMMNKETWLNSQEAVEKGFADEIMFSKTDAVASVSVTLPNSVINKVRNIMKQETINKDDERLAAIEAKLEIIDKKLKNTKPNKTPVNKKPKRFL